METQFIEPIGAIERTQRHIAQRQAGTERVANEVAQGRCPVGTDAVCTQLPRDEAVRFGIEGRCEVELLEYGVDQGTRTRTPRKIERAREIRWPIDRGRGIDRIVVGPFCGMRRAAREGGVAADAPG